MRYDILIVSCGRTKRPLDNVRALDLYDGALFRVIRKHRADLPKRILILSAKYGLIDSETLISNYDAVLKSNPPPWYLEAVKKQAEQLELQGNIVCIMSEKYHDILKGMLPPHQWVKQRIGMQLGEVVKIGAL